MLHEIESGQLLGYPLGCGQHIANIRRQNIDTYNEQYNHDCVPRGFLDIFQSKRVSLISPVLCQARCQPSLKQSQHLHDILKFLRVLQDLINNGAIKGAWIL